MFSFIKNLVERQIKGVFLLILFFTFISAAQVPPFFNYKVFASQKALRPIPNYYWKHVCGAAVAGHVSCLSDVVVDALGTPLVSAGVPARGYGPKQFHIGYNLPCTPGGPVQARCATPGSFGPQTIALILPYNNPIVESDLTP